MTRIQQFLLILNIKFKQILVIHLVYRLTNTPSRGIKNETIKQQWNLHTKTDNHKFAISQTDKGNLTFSQILAEIFVFVTT